MNTTVTVLPLPVTLLMSSQPERLMTLFAGFVKTFHVAEKSLPVTGLPSLHTAVSLYVNWIVSGFFFVIFGFAVQSAGTKSAFALRIWQPYQTLLSTRLVAYRLLPTHGPCRFGGSWSWMKTTVLLPDCDGARRSRQGR